MMVDDDEIYSRGDHRVAYLESWLVALAVGKRIVDDTEIVIGEI